MVTKQFVKAGKAIFTIHNNDGTHFTYRVQAKKSMFNQDQIVYMVGLLVGPDNTKDYSYVGMLNDNGSIRFTKKSKYDATTLPVKVFNWAMKIVWLERQNSLPNGYGIKNEEMCGHCRRKLTTPESIESGFGPTCVKKIHHS